MPLFVTSKDGTKIAYDAVGNGPVVIVVLGALNARRSGTRLAKLLAFQFTAITYDRRGRGASGNNARYSPEREVEDVAALIGAAAGSVCLYGHSSGAAIAIDVAIELRKQVRRLAIYGAPYALDGGARKAARE
jgi:pimeloyl-ACP methyl ester carboxylesterase